MKIPVQLSSDTLIMGNAYVNKKETLIEGTDNHFIYFWLTAKEAIALADRCFEAVDTQTPLELMIGDKQYYYFNRKT